MRTVLLYLLIAYLLVMNGVIASFVVSLAYHKHLPACTWAVQDKGNE